MLCRICGTPIKAGEKFCSLCGTKAEVTENIYQNQAQQPYVQQSNNQPPYGQQSYRSEDSRQSYRQQSNNQQPYRQQNNQQQYGQSFDQPFGGQPRGNVYYSAPTRSKKGLWITLSLVAVLAVAAVLILTVFGDQLAANSQGTLPSMKTLPFKGDTIQTKFANDTAKVFTDAYDIFGNVGIDLNELAEQPFEIKLDTTVKSMGEKANLSIDAAYDDETFGVNMNAEGSSIKILLIEDVVYMDMLGSAVGVDFNSTADLSGPMTLKDRLMALVEGASLPQNVSSEEGYMTLAGLIMQNMLNKGDYTALAELLLNSINESCFENNRSGITLTLHADDIVSTMRTFAEKLEADEGLKKMYVDFIKESSGTSIDAIKQINDAADTLEGLKETSDLEIVWNVSYKNEKPVSFKIMADDGDQKYAYSFGYEQKEDSTDVTFELTSGNSSDNVSGMCNFKKAGSGTEFTGSMITQGEIITFYGNIAFSGNNTRGTITMNVPNIGEASIDFNMTVNIGMPAVKVKDDGRFNIDTGGATIIDGSSFTETYGLPGVY